MYNLKHCTLACRSRYSSHAGQASQVSSLSLSLSELRAITVDPVHLQHVVFLSFNENIFILIKSLEPRLQHAGDTMHMRLSGHAACTHAADKYEA